MPDGCVHSHFCYVMAADQGRQVVDDEGKKQEATGQGVAPMDRHPPANSIR